MKIILIHNIYQQAGGEELVFKTEGDLLREQGHKIETLVFDNKSINNSFAKFLSGIKVIYNLTSAKRLKKRIKEFKPDLIHVHNFFPLASPSIFFVAKKYGVPIVVTLHNYRLICPSATLFYDHSIYERSINSLFPVDAILKGVYRNSRIETAAMVMTTRFHNLIGTWKYKVDKFIVLTEFARTKFANSILRTAPDALIVKPNFVIDKGPGEMYRENFFLYIGRLSVEKGVETLLQSLTIHKYNLVIIGEGFLRDKVENFAGSNGNLSYLGRQDKDVVMRHLKKCKALILPSNWYEGFPMTILEAFSAGTPVIASCLGAMMEVVQDNVNGLHFEAGNANDLIHKIKQLESNADLAKQLSDHARATYLNRYTPEKNYKLLFEIYSQLLDSRSESSSNREIN
jgi:glycosyltransferase involved in cell wall biosynthesis